MVYGADTMIPVDVTSPTWHRLNFESNHNMEGLENSTDFI